MLESVRNAESPECSRLAAAIGSEREHWKCPRRESHSQSLERSKNRRSTSTMNVSTESDTKQGTLSELAERLWNFHESASALTNCLQTRDTTRKMDQSMLKGRQVHVLQITGGNEPMTWTAHYNHRAQATGNGSRCFRTETSSGSLCPPAEAATEIPCSHFETNRSGPFLFRYNQSFAWIAGVVSQMAIITSNSCYPRLRTEPENGSTNSRRLFLTTTILNLIFNEAEQKGKSHNIRTYSGHGSDGSSTDKLSLDLKFNPRNTAISSRSGEEPCMCK